MRKQNLMMFPYREKIDSMEEIQKNYKKWGFESASQLIRTATRALIDVKKKNV